MKLLAGPVDIGKLEGIGPLGGEGKMFEDKTTSLFYFSDTISLIVGVMTIISFIWFMFVMVTGAIGWLSSGGDKNKLQQAQKQLTNGIIGIALVISALLIIKIVEKILGITILDFYSILKNL